METTSLVTIEVRAILISKYGELILQETENGTWTLFGGPVKESETVWSGLRRELFEELEYIYLGAQVEFFKIFKVKPTESTQGKEIHVYIIKDVDDRKLILHKGKSIIIDKVEEIKNNINKVTKESELALTEYLGSSKYGKK
jgi:ADP-ribose pyrophosphatase YjhB (NUDIX family)